MRFQKLLPVLIALTILFGWEISSRSEIISVLFFPPPSKILVNLFHQIQSGEILMNTLITLGRLVLGILFGGSIGLSLGLTMGWSSVFRKIVDPFVAAFHPMPKIAILPLVMIIFGIGELSKIVVIAMGGFFPLLINTMVGVRQIEPIYFDVAKNYGAKTLTLFMKVIIPGSMPSILGGFRIAVNSAFLITIAVELLTAQEGMGATIWLAWETFRIINLYSALFVVLALGICFNYIIERMSKYLIRWSFN